MTDYLTPIYTDVRKWILSLFPAVSVVRGYQNLVPAPENGIVITVLFEKRLDQLSQKTVDGTFIVFDSIQASMQVDCYGDGSQSTCREICTWWQTMEACDAMQNVQPLYCSDPKDLTFVNEAGIYELRFMTLLELQYNTSYEKSVESTTENPNVDIEGF